METTERIRGRRVRFKHPVRVTTMSGELKAWRTLAANLSNEGLFVRMPQPLQPGTRVAIALEAGGRSLPLAEGEVRWARSTPSELEDEFPGCGVAFTDFLHPRASELVQYLVGTLESGRPLRTAPTSRRLRLLRGAAIGAGVLLSAALVAFLIEVGTDAAAPPEAVEASPAVQVTPTPVAEPVAVAQVILPPVALPAVVAPDAVPTASADDLAPVALSTEPPAAVAASVSPALVPAPKTGTVPPPQRSSGRVVLPTGAAKSLSWTPREDGFALRTELRDGAKVSHVFPLAGPPRLVLELTGAAPKKNFVSAEQSGQVTRVRMARQGKYTRVVLDLAAPVRKVVPLGATTLVSF